MRRNLKVMLSQIYQLASMGAFAHTNHSKTKSTPRFFSTRGTINGSNHIKRDGGRRTSAWNGHKNRCFYFTGNKETMRQVVALGGTCRAYTVDLCDRTLIYQVANRVKEEVGKVSCSLKTIYLEYANLCMGFSFCVQIPSHTIGTWNFDTNWLYLTTR